MIRHLLKRKKYKRTGPKPLAAGQEAPDFSLNSSTGESVSLSDLRGRPVVLVFYPADHSPVCSSQLVLYNEAYQMFDEHGAQLVGISVDDLASHEAFADSLGLQFPLLSDADPVGEIARTYGVFDEDEQVAERALFVLDAEGRIRWEYIAPRGVNPGANGILEALDSLNDSE